MVDLKRNKSFFTVSRVFFLLIVIPSLLIVSLIATSILQISATSKKRAITVSQKEIQTKTITTAEKVADFLSERKKDILITTVLPETAKAYQEFIDTNKQVLWVKKDGTLIKVIEPIYVEMSRIDKQGNEIIKISDGKIVSPNQLKNVSNPANTRYKSEDFFAKTKSLNKGEVYVSPVTGWYVNKFDFEKGNRFEGVVRFATPLFDKQGFAGLIILALDVRHLAKFTDTIIPTETTNVLETDVSSGNYAYMVDNRGFVISHPNDYYIAGLRKDGTPVPPVTSETYNTMVAKGEEVLNLNLLGFKDPNLPEIAKNAAAGKAQSMDYTLNGRATFVAYAPIPFYCSDYPKPAGFGWIGMEIDLEKFKEQALMASKETEKEAQAWITTIILVLAMAIILLFIITSILSRGITRSIEAEVPTEATKIQDHQEEEN